METVTVKLLKNVQSQAVRVPKPFQFIGTDEVIVRLQGNSLVITPKRKSWLSLTESIVVADDFLVSRHNILIQTNDCRTRYQL